LVAGIFLFKEKAQPVRVIFIMLIIVGIAGVQITAGV